MQCTPEYELKFAEICYFHHKGQCSGEFCVLFIYYHLVWCRKVANTPLVYRSVRFSQRYSAVKAARKYRDLDAVVRRGRRGGTVMGRRERLGWC